LPNEYVLVKLKVRKIASHYHEVVCDAPHSISSSSKLYAKEFGLCNQHVAKVCTNENMKKGVRNEKQ